MFKIVPLTVSNSPKISLINNLIFHLKCRGVGVGVEKWPLISSASSRQKYTFVNFLDVLILEDVQARYDY